MQSLRLGESFHRHTDFGEQKKIIKAIFDSTQSFIALISPDYRIMFFNKKALQFCQLLNGGSIRIGDSFLDFIDESQHNLHLAFKENFSKAILRGCPVVSEKQIQFHDVARWMRIEYTPVYDEAAIIGVALRIIDISERKQKELQIEKQNEQLRMISWIQSHETRQPIATILGLIHILDKTTLTPDNHKIVTMLEATVEKLDAVIRETVVRSNAMYK